MEQKNKEPGAGVPETREQSGAPLVNIVKGAVIAIGAVLPGISGGALCVILGIYRQVMALLCHPLKEIKKQWKFLLFVGIGFAAGTLLSSRVIGIFLEKAETHALFLFIGLIAGTFPSLFKEARIQGAPRRAWGALFAAAVLMLSWMIPMSLGGAASVTPSIWWWCACGVLWGLGIVVPGMSPSNIFLFLGLAEPMYAAIGRFDLRVIMPMGVCLLLTVLALSKAVDYCLRRQYAVFMHAVIGVVIASTLVILPPVKLLISRGYTFGTGAVDWLLYALCFAGGLACAQLLSRIRKPEPQE
ncbi:DUF368 domain-containing protein [Treponema brennaborense]|uniref:DUF368 domain-containing protein n=1 Tax=Treponema brennaborense (strain DSM 12168 / CIP 105900 / DD5/3) TaxID=906968 RepID=F4LKA8_TREBD|nr:DUF368 domain-containing protein [Treponema brennaborense]AEE15497.1 protein of unknown function DUF368 [Treponema brennaborense DSM 12168]